MSIVLHIERVVLDHELLRDERANAVQLAVELALAVRLARPGIADALRDVGCVADLPPVPLPPARYSDSRLGSRIARAIGDAIERIEPPSNQALRQRTWSWQGQK